MPRIIGFKDGRAIEEDPGGVTMHNMPVGINPLGRNTSGTFSTPTPSDVRYGDVTTTEFEGNAGFIVPRDAASMRNELGQRQVPGGIVIPTDLSVVNVATGTAFIGHWDYESATTSAGASNGMFRMSQAIPPVLGSDMEIYLNDTDRNGLIYTWEATKPLPGDTLLARNNDGTRIELLVTLSTRATGYLINAGTVQYVSGSALLLVPRAPAKLDWQISLLKKGPT